MHWIPRTLTCLVAATFVWLPTLHLWFARSPQAVAGPLAAHQLARWLEDTPDDAAIARLRATNPEWDLMARTFAVLAFANLALREPEARASYLEAIDRIIDATVADEAREGMSYFLLPYGRHGGYLDPSSRSVFVDGELALMIAARELVEPDPAHASLVAARIASVIGQIERGPVLLAESYPDEAWLFCNSVALAAVRLHDRALGTPDAHADLIRRWVASARIHLVDPRTGLLVSKLTLAGRAQDGPEGSTLWLTLDMLRVIDDELARDQYARARRELRGSLWGFAWAREWPASWPGREDIDSGPTIPIVGANAGSSGLALVAARAFHDDGFVDGLIASLQFAGFPVDGGARFAAGNPLADAVVMYALVSGPLWQRAGVR